MQDIAGLEKCKTSSGSTLPLIIKAKPTESNETTEEGREPSQQRHFRLKSAFSGRVLVI